MKLVLNPMLVINLNTINHKTTNRNLASLAINDPMKIPEFSSPSIYHWIFAFWASSTWVMSFNKETCCSLKVVESSFPINWLSIDSINSWNFFLLIKLPNAFVRILHPKIRFKKLKFLLKRNPRIMDYVQYHS